MKRRTAGRVAKPKLCAHCGGVMSERRPVYLVATTLGQVVGPFHAGCAERIALAHKGKPTARSVPGETFGRVGLEAREETLPW